jgi:DNA-binding NtrC family response regulator
VDRNKTSTRITAVLLVDEEPQALSFLRTALELRSCRVEVASSGEAALQMVEAGSRPHMVLLGLQRQGLETLEKMRRLLPEAKIVMASAETGLTTVVRAMQLGANDFLCKPLRAQEIASLLAPGPAKGLEEEAKAEAAARSSAGAEDEPIVELPNDVTFICASPVMRKLRQQAKVVAPSDIPILLLGESGTGKEVLASWIHYCSHRADQPFLKVNCAAVPADLLESELFGYEAGAFTGATKSKPGKFEQCNGGTILLDEISEMPSALQAKLLHVLQDNEFSRLGARQITKVDVRVLSATNLSVPDAIAAQKLRPDLYYRLNGLSFRLPPLRERREEIPVLMTHFMRRMASEISHPAPPLTPRLLEACLSYSWPGNLRELWHFVNRYMVLCDEELAVAELAGNGEPAAVFARGLKSMVRAVKDDAEAIAIAEALRQTNGKRKQAAALLKISYKALLYKMRRLDLRPPAVKHAD